MEQLSHNCKHKIFEINVEKFVRPLENNVKLKAFSYKVTWNQRHGPVYMNEKGFTIIISNRSEDDLIKAIEVLNMQFHIRGTIVWAIGISKIDENFKISCKISNYISVKYFQNQCLQICHFLFNKATFQDLESIFNRKKTKLEAFCSWSVFFLLEWL